MKRTVTALAGTFGLAVLLVGVAPAAFADVTNPADNPHKIEVKGDDGNTYTDGQDTLPGFDDEECTYIPGAWFDFDKNRVYYADGQSIPWTEWERATGYKDWLAKKNAASTGSGGSSGSTTTTTTTTTKATTTTKPAAKPTTSTTKAGGTASTTSGTSKATTGTVAAGAATPGAGASTEPSVSPSPSASASAQQSATPSASATAGGDDAKSEANGVATTAASQESAGSIGGIAILGSLAALGGLAYGAHWLWRRKSARGLA